MATIYLALFLNRLQLSIVLAGYINIKTKNLSVQKERSIDSKAQKKINKITKFRINAFL